MDFDVEKNVPFCTIDDRYYILCAKPGVGRNKTTYVTWRSDVENKAGGDYYNTNFPQPTFVSSNRYYLHADSSAYADFDFRHPDYHELQFWALMRTLPLPWILRRRSPRNPSAQRLQVRFSNGIM